MGIGTMSRGEKAVIYVKSQYLNQCPFMPTVEGIEEVHFEVELVHFVQVWKLFGAVVYIFGIDYTLTSSWL